MDDAADVCGVERVGDLRCPSQAVVHLAADGLDAMLQCFALEQLHGDEMLVFVFADFVDGADVRMVERRGSTRLALETVERWRSGDAGGRNLGRRAAELDVFGLIDDPHATATQLFDHR